MTATLEEYWITLIHKAIAEKNLEEMPKFDKAMVVIEIITPRGTNNKKSMGYLKPSYKCYNK